MTLVPSSPENAAHFRKLMAEGRQEARDRAVFLMVEWRAQHGLPPFRDRGIDEDQLDYIRELGLANREKVDEQP